MGDFHKEFYVTKEEIPIITLMPEQLHFLINDTSFHDNLLPNLQESKLIFILGCTVALRVSDLFAIRFCDLKMVGSFYYLGIRSIKTEVSTRIKLPDYAVNIIDHFKKTAKKRKTLLPRLSVNQFNKNIKVLAEKAGWTNERVKVRSRRGKSVELCMTDKKSFRFCDLLSSHTMRRTAVTTMLILGMPEHVVKKISGHAQNSKDFHRYVNLVQSSLQNQQYRAGLSRCFKC